MAIFEFKTRVSYDDIDSKMRLTLRGVMGMMQEAAIIHSDLSGYSVRTIEQTNVVWVLSRWRIRSIGEAKWSDALVVRTWPRTMDRVTSERAFEIVNDNGSVVAVGESVWVLVNADTGRIVRIPSQVADAYELTDKRVFDDEPAPFVGAEERVVFSGVVQKRDIDSNQHVNNRVYLDYAIEALENDEISRYSEVRIHYRKQLLCGETVQCVYRKGIESCCVDICSSDASDLRATVQFCK